MEPKKFGRTLGIGVRVASNILRSHSREAAQRTASTVREKAPANDERAPIYERTRAAAERGKTLGQGVGRGTRSFGRAVLGPLGHAGRVLWLEVTGLFFALFALFFAQNMYRFRSAWRAGPEHSHFLAYALLTFVFSWFCASSFLRARRKTRAAR